MCATRVPTRAPTSVSVSLPRPGIQLPNPRLGTLYFKQQYPLILELIQKFSAWLLYANFAWILVSSIQRRFLREGLRHKEGSTRSNRSSSFPLDCAIYDSNIIVGRPCALLRGPALSRRKRFVRGANAIFFDLLRVLYTKNQSIVATSDQNL
jgi:hypothetical protein